MKRNCLECTTLFVIPKYKPNAKFCSAACRDKGNAKLSARARGDAQRDRGEGKSYRKLYGRHEHRVVMEEKLGRKLFPGEIVHHIDHNKRNNHPDNLMVMTRSEHQRLHMIKFLVCQLEGCQTEHTALGLCDTHYRKFKRGELLWQPL